MVYPLTISEALEQVGRRLQKQCGTAPIPVSELKGQAAPLCGLRESSVVPSDFCYNRTNAGISIPKQPMFVYEGRGQYSFVGMGYPYTGVMLHKPRGQAEHVVGRWDGGAFTPSKGD